MSKMSELAIEIEEALSAGSDVSTISKDMQSLYGFSPAEALQVINQVSYMLTFDQDQGIIGL